MRFILRSSPARLWFTGFSLFLAVSLLTRLLLVLKARGEVTFDASLAAAFGIGVCYDMAASVFVAIPWLLVGVLLPTRLLHSRVGKWFLPAFAAVMSALLMFVAIAEWCFWDEFSARFNFIAVDYLVWTQEVWGNISESYPLVPIFFGIAILTAGLAYGLQRNGWTAWVVSSEFHGWQSRAKWLLFGLAAPAFVGWSVSESRIPAFSNQFHGELAKNGCWAFFAAYRGMELDYHRWYPVLPDSDSLVAAKKLLVTPAAPASSPAIDDLHRSIVGRGPEHRWNVIFVCMESMSTEFTGLLGNPAGLTPNLDRLAKHSVFFENLYATGTRTVRGMEAITLGVPPTPGQSILYRPEGTFLTTSFSPFLERGYDCAFFYGGNGQFDFMNRYFSTAGCRVMDVGAWNQGDVTFKTAWGACDEDLFNKTLREADADHASGKPFHFFCMTTSNHRPYDFPNGRIDLPSHSGRNAAVKYADWAVGHLISEAAKRPWFKDTLFVICADHCASSAGKTELDVTKFRIPAMIYNPTLVAATNVPVLSSQIDVMPTVLGLLNWNNETLSYGHDLLAPSAAEMPGRAFVSNYQKIALLKQGEITILKPNRQVSSYACDLRTGAFSPANLFTCRVSQEEATAYYQSASWLFQTGRLKQKNARPIPFVAQHLHPTAAPEPLATPKPSPN